MSRTPKKMDYYNLFGQLASCACKAAELFCSDATPKEKAKRLKEVEHRADDIVHSIIDKLNEHQDPPLRDLDDIQRLVHNIDNIVDYLEEAASRISIFGLLYIPEFIKFGHLAKEATGQIKLALPLLKNVGENNEAITDACIKINEIESKADEHHRTILEELMSATPEDIESMWEKLKIKEVLRLLEDALDQCEDVGNFIEALKTKNA